MFNIATPKLLTVQVASSLSTASSKDLSEAHLAPATPGAAASMGTTGAAVGALAHSYANMRIPGRRLAAVMPSNQSRRKYPGIHNNSRTGKALDADYAVHGPTFIGRDVTSLARLGSDNNAPEKDTCGRHFLFDKKWKSDRISEYDFRDERYLRPNGCVPPLPRDYQVHRSGNLQRYSPRKELTHSTAWPTLGACEAYDLTLGPAILLPSAISLNGRHPFSTDGYKHRPRVNHRTGSLFTLGTQQKARAYPDPVSGAPPSFTQRLSEISSLEAETVRQERIRKMKKNKKWES